MVMHFPALVTLAALVLFFAIIVYVGHARIKYKVKAPATTGNEDFERIFRVQMNTLENLMVFLPSLWLFSSYVSPLWAGVLGLIWILGRVDYAISYTKSAKLRTRGFSISAFAVVTLLVGSVIGVIVRIVSGL